MEDYETFFNKFLERVRGYLESCLKISDVDDERRCTWEGIRASDAAFMPVSWVFWISFAPPVRAIAMEASRRYPSSDRLNTDLETERQAKTCRGLHLSRTQGVS